MSSQKPTAIAEEEAMRRMVATTLEQRAYAAAHPQAWTIR